MSHCDGIKSTSTLEPFAVLLTVMTLWLFQGLHSNSAVFSWHWLYSVQWHCGFCAVWHVVSDAHRTLRAVQQMLLLLLLLSHDQAKLRFVPVSYSHCYLHQWGTWSTSGYHCPEQKTAAEKTSKGVMCWIHNRIRGILFKKNKTKHIWSHTIFWRTLNLSSAVVASVCIENSPYFNKYATCCDRQQRKYRLNLRKRPSRPRTKQEPLSRKSRYRTGKCVTFKDGWGFIVFFLSSNQNSLGLVCSEGPPTLCQPFRGHFRFFNMKPSCLSGLWTLLCPIFRPSMISQLSASCRGAESVVWGINPPRINPKFETPTPL